MDEPWFQDGLGFTCTRCGNCCTGQPGFVWVSQEEIADIAVLRGESPSEIEAMYTRPYRQGRSLRERENGDCTFWDRQKGCTIYAVRPRQCRTWPFWESTLATPETWADVQKTCPGAGHGELIAVEEITRRLKVIRI